MTAFLTRFFCLSLAGGLITCLLLLIANIFEKRFSARWNYFLRLIALLFYFIPFSFPVPYVPHMIEFPSQIVFGTAEETARPFAAANAGLLFTWNDFLTVIAIIWITGVVATAAWNLICCIRFRRAVLRCGQPIEEDAQRRFHEICKDMDIQKPPRILKCGRAGTPMITMTPHMTILLPDMPMNDVELELILRHELTHYQQKHLLFKLLLLAAQILHWFNPAVYFLQRSTDKWCERACDELLTTTMDRHQRYQYSMTILSMMENAADIKMSAPLCQKGSELKGRLNQIMKARQPGRITKALACTAACVFIGTGAYLSAALGSYTVQAQPLLKASASESSKADTPLVQGAPEKIPLKRKAADGVASSSSEAAGETLPVKNSDGEEIRVPSLQYPVVAEKIYIGATFNGYPGHTGVDFVAPFGSDIVAAAGGTVISAEWGNAYGNVIIIDHGDGCQTLYAHCLEFFVKEGDVVKQGDKIASLGKTGNVTGAMLHFELRLNDRPVDLSFLLENDVGEKTKPWLYFAF